MVRQASIGQQLLTLETAQHQRSAIIQGFDAFLGRHDDVMAQLELQLQQDTAAVDASSQQVLGLKKTLLDERKKLGIHEQGYQQALQEYEQLLNRGESLTSEDQSRLVTLEGQLSATENRLVSSSQGLMTQIQGLNQLKERVNQATQTLVQQLTHQRCHRGQQSGHQRCSGAEYCRCETGFANARRFFNPELYRKSSHDSKAQRPVGVFRGTIGSGEPVSGSQRDTDHKN